MLGRVAMTGMRFALTGKDPCHFCGGHGETRGSLVTGMQHSYEKEVKEDSNGFRQIQQIVVCWELNTYKQVVYWYIAYFL